MVDDARVQGLVEAALEARRLAEDVCRDCPELLPEVRRRLEQVRAARADLEHLFPTTPLTTAYSGDACAASTAGLPQIPGYDILEELGRGGMGVVLKGHDPDLGRDLAVKVLLERHRDNADMVRRFLEEAQVTSQLQHPGLPPVHEIGRLPDRRPYFTMKLVVGRTLADLLKERESPAQDLPRFLQIFEQTCQTLAYAHARGVIHRDLKPMNVMVGAFGEVQVMDWGLAKVVTAGSVRTVRSERTDAESQAGTVMGTPAYMAPEQACGDVEGLDARCDVFGLGALLCEILTGAPPYRMRDKGELLRQAARADLADAFARLDGCGAEGELIRLTKACLAAEPAGRPGDAAAVAVAMTVYLAGMQERLHKAELAQARAEEERKRRRLNAVRAALVLAAFVTALLIGTGISSYFAVTSNANYQDARKHEGEARDALVKVGEANAQLTLKNNELEETLARGWLRSLSRNDYSSRDLELARANLQVDSINRALDSALETPDILARLDDAEKSAGRAVHYAANIDSGPNPHTAEADYLLAQIHGMRGRAYHFKGAGEKAAAEYALGKSYCDQSIEMLNKVYPDGPHDHLLHVRLCRAWLNLQLDHVEEAREEAEDALHLFSDAHKLGGDNVWVDCALFHRLLLQIEDRAGNPDRAAGHAEAIRQAVYPFLNKCVPGMTASEANVFFQEYVDPGLQDSLRLSLSEKSPQAMKESAAEWLINGKAKIGEVMAAFYQQAGGGKNKEYLKLVQREAFLLYGAPVSDLGSGATLDELDELELQKRDLARRNPASEVRPRVTLASIRDTLAPDDVYIDVFCLRPDLYSERAYYAWVLKAKDPVVVVRLGGAAEIDRLVKALQNHMENCAGENGLFATIGAPDAEGKLRRDCLDPLSNLILKPLLPLAAGKKHWVVSPDGLLWNVAWAALIVPGTDRYAIEDESFRYVISGRDLLQQPAPATMPGEPWIMADPDLNMAPPGLSGKLRPKNDPSLRPRLEGSRKEGALVAQCLRPFFGKEGPRVLTDGAATKAAFLNVDHPRILYLSTHGFFILPTSLREDDGLRVDPLLCCGLTFAGSNFLPDGKEDKDKMMPGLLTGAEVLAVDLRGTELVVLSACQSGTGVERGGQSPADLCQAFHLAGARAVVSSLWSVSDDATRELMVAFMKSYAKKPEGDKADALAKAQREMIKIMREGPDHYAHPFFWAAFTLSGS